MLTRAENNLRVIWLLIVRLALLAALGYFVYRVRSIMIAVIIAVMLAYVMLPAVEFICRLRIARLCRRRARLAATTLVFIVLIAITILAGRMFIAPFSYELTKLATNFDDYVQQSKALFTRAAAWYQALPPDAQDFLRDQDYTKITAMATDFSQRILAGTVEWLTYIVDIILIPVLAFYFVLDSHSLRRDVLALVPRRKMREALILTRNTATILQSYVVGQLILCFIAGVLTALVLSWLRMDYVLVLSVFSGITRAIPILGPIISGIPIVLLGITTRSMDTGLVLLVFVIVMHFAESKFIMPKLIGDRMRLHPAVVIIVLLIGAEFFGILGMFLAAPVAAVVRESIRFYIISPRRRAEHSAAATPPELTGFGLRSGKL